MLKKIIHLTLTPERWSPSSKATGIKTVKVTNGPPKTAPGDGIVVKFQIEVSEDAFDPGAVHVTIPVEHVYRPVQVDMESELVEP